MFSFQNTPLQPCKTLFSFRKALSQPAKPCFIFKTPFCNPAKPSFNFKTHFRKPRQPFSELFRLIAALHRPFQKPFGIVWRGTSYKYLRIVYIVLSKSSTLLSKLSTSSFNSYISYSASSNLLLVLMFVITRTIQATSATNEIYGDHALSFSIIVFILKCF